jgi:hypothetical protein
VLLLLAFIAVICTFTHHPDIAKKYLFVVGLADFGHIYATYRGLGDDWFYTPGRWNTMVWANIGVSVFLNVVRWATLAGVFGTVGGRKAGRAKAN